MSSQLARISRGALKNLPSIFLIEKRGLSTYNHGLPTPTDGLKKSSSNSWNKVKVSPCIRHPFLPSSSSSSLPYTTSTDDQVEIESIDRCKKFCKEMAKIHRVLLDYDEPHYHLIDGVKVLSAVSKVWKKIHPNFEFDNGFGDLETSLILDQKKATSKNISAAKWTILEFLLGCDDPKLAAYVLSEAMQLWKFFINQAESANKDKLEVHCAALRVYKSVISNVDDPDNITKEFVKGTMKEIDSLVKNTPILEYFMKYFRKEVEAVLKFFFLRKMRERVGLCESLERVGVLK